MRVISGNGRVSRSKTWKTVTKRQTLVGASPEASVLFFAILGTLASRAPARNLSSPTETGGYTCRASRCRKTGQKKSRERRICLEDGSCADISRPYLKHKLPVKWDVILGRTVAGMPHGTASALHVQCGIPGQWCHLLQNSPNRIDNRNPRDTFPETRYTLSLISVYTDVLKVLGTEKQKQKNRKCARCLDVTR